MNINLSIEDVRSELARRKLQYFSQLLFPTDQITTFHDSYYEILTHFAFGRIKRLIVTVPPQHGKSSGSTIKLPAFMLGLNPNLNIAIASYSTIFARKFNRYIQRVIDTPQYSGVFPNTKLNDRSETRMEGSFLRNADEFEIVGYRGSLKTVGRGGALTGNPVDIAILDDLYKDSSEGNSPVIRESVIDWYSSVLEKRLHNDSQVIIVFTRWHEDDLIGYIEKNENVVEVSSIDQALNVEGWVKINFEAIKESQPTELDPREQGEALWPERHSLEKMLKERMKQPHVFNTMNQGRPESKEGLLYSDFRTYDRLPSNLIRIANYTDTADLGDDYLCSINYAVDANLNIYVTDILYTKESIDLTIPKVSNLIKRGGIQDAYIESNNGGRGFALNVEQNVSPYCRVTWFHQSKNKESRILTNSSGVNAIFMPEGWNLKFPDFYSNIVSFKRKFSANRYDDAADVLTGIYEKEVLDNYTAITVF